MKSNREVSSPSTLSAHAETAGGPPTSLPRSGHPNGERADGAPRLAHPRLRLFALSFLMLFVELALIRWTGANIIYLSYFSNFVLLGSFLGIGLGFLRPTIGGASLFTFAAPLLAGAVAYVHFYPVQIDRTSRQ